VDCFAEFIIGRRFAPTRWLAMTQTHVRILAARCARGLLKTSAPKTEGVGNAGRPMHPQPRVRILVASMHTSIHSEPPEITRHSRTQWFTAYTALSPVIGFLVTVILRICGLSARLGSQNLRKT
jgi:hypothetical protein